MKTAFLTEYMRDKYIWIFIMKILIFKKRKQKCISKDNSALQQGTQNNWVWGLLYYVNMRFLYCQKNNKSIIIKNPNICITLSKTTWPNKLIRSDYTTLQYEYFFQPNSLNFYLKLLWTRYKGSLNIIHLSQSI